MQYLTRRVTLSGVHPAVQVTTFSYLSIAMFTDTR